MDDHGNGANTTSRITIAPSQSGEIETLGDADWFRAELTSGAVYTLELKASHTANGTL